MTGHLRNPRFLALALALAPKSVSFGADMRRRGVQHVHAHFGTHAALSAMIAARTASIPFSFTVHAYDLFVDRTYLAAKAREAAFVATISDYNKRLLADLVPEAADRIHVVRCGIAPDAVEPRDESEHRTDGPGPRLLSVAALLPSKGLEHLIGATSLLRSRLPGISVTLVGEGPERQALEGLRDRLGLTGVVELVGAVPAEQVKTHLRRADIFVLPSVKAPNGDMDGIPVALMEAMAAGIPVVGSRLSGIPELVHDGETGVLAPPGDQAALADGVERLWRDRALRVRLAAAGRRLVLDEYDSESNARRLSELIEASIAVGRRGIV